VLARELLVAGKRSLQFLYLRGMSHYLRQNQNSALPFFEEGIKIDPEVNELRLKQLKTV